MTTVKSREYFGLADANEVEYRVKKEAAGRLAWHKRWGHYLEVHNNWVSSDIQRALRKPSMESLEWLVWQRKFEVPQVGEWMTRHEGVKIGSPNADCSKQNLCKPHPWPRTTYGEIGWLGQHKNCKLEIYDTNYNRKPPMPWYSTKISAMQTY